MMVWVIAKLPLVKKGGQTKKIGCYGYKGKNKNKVNDCSMKNQYEVNYVHPDTIFYAIFLRSYSSADDHKKGQTPMENAQT